MKHYVYILYSASHDVYYKGYTVDYNQRLKDHNLGKSKYTAGKGPWELVYVELLPTKREALIRERQLKKQNRAYLEWLIQQEKNIIRESGK
ncbi:MAG: GIY-YIG nuclease family protein [Bacteroidia bacterium]